jgi:hypothetical protein
MPEFTYLSFDGIRLTYTFESGTVDAFATKLAERSPFEEDGDVDFYGLYGTWRANDALSLDAYWLWLRDARALNDTNLDLLSEWIEDAIGLDDYSVTNLHTVGLWASGVCQGFDYNAQVAYQFGDADAIGVLFSPFAYGDNGAEFDEWAADVEVGYTFEVMGWRPRVFLGGAYFGGEDNRDISFWEWLNPLAPWIRPESSVSFNRLFSNTVYSCLFDEMAELTNFVTARVGIEARPTECLETGLDLAYFRALETFDQPLHFWLWRFRVPILPRFSFLTDESDADLGWQLGLWMKYHYTDDLAFELGWQHLFTGDGLKDGNFTDLNGLLFNGGTDDQDADYFYIETALTF